MKISIQQAINHIKNGEVVAFPTETVYGLGADAFNVEAIKKTFSTKGRPVDNPLIVHISDLEQLSTLAADIPTEAVKLADAFWPGPLTMILPKKPSVPDIVTAALPTVAVRMPNHPIALEIISKTGPLTAPSANRSGKPSPTRPAHIKNDYGDELMFVDGGISEIGIESTVLDLTPDNPTILRPGVITAQMIEDIIGKPVGTTEGFTHGDNTPKSPGTKYTHYKPKADVSWIERPYREFTKNGYYIFHTGVDAEPSERVFLYNGNYIKLAKNLYDHFRDADYKGTSNIYIETFPENIRRSVAPALYNRISKSIGR